MLLKLNDSQNMHLSVLVEKKKKKKRTEKKMQT